MHKRKNVKRILAYIYMPVFLSLIGFLLVFICLSPYISAVYSVMSILSGETTETTVDVSGVPDFKLEKSVMVGDSLSSDILGGKNAGLTTIWYQKDRNITDDGAIHPDYRIYELSELPDLLKKLK